MRRREEGDPLGEECRAWFSKAGETGLLRPVDRALGTSMAQWTGECPLGTRSVIAIAVALLSASSREGHTLLDLGPAPASPFLENLPASLPPPARWAHVLGEYVGREDHPAPVILDRDGLYLLRFYQAEVRVAQGIARRLLRDRAHSSAPRALDPSAQGMLDRFFPLQGTPSDAVNAGRSAAAASLDRSMVVITGAPGTGKTWTAARILALHRTLFPDLRIVAAAPTGKAAARMGEAIAHSKISDPAPPSMTLHRLLEAGSRGFGRGGDRPLDWDLVLIDELSMVDLPLMDRLLLALPETSRLILTGDRDQLASVGAGTVMSDLCDTLSNDPEGSGGRGSFTVLTHNFRQSEFPALRSFARAVSSGDAKEALEILTRGEAGLTLIEASSSDPIPYALLSQGWAPLSASGTPEEALGRLDGFMALTPLREGPMGSHAINRAVHARLRRQQKGGISASPVLVLENSYETGLMNGDLGVHSRADLHFQKGGTSLVLPERLAPEWGFAYAMTVHKSQGSEFDHVLLLLGDVDHPLLDRALLYTGATRARTRLTVWGSSGNVARMIRRPVTRSSALKERLSSFLS